MSAKLGQQEKMVLDHLAEAWNSWVHLGNRSEEDDDDFCKAIHAAQRLIAIRVARRADPDIWRMPE